MADFDSKLKAARKLGKAQSKRDGTSTQAIVTRLMDSGEAGQVEVLIAVLRERGTLPGWLQSAPAHEVHEMLSAWGSIRHAMAQYRKEHK